MRLFQLSTLDCRDNFLVQTAFGVVRPGNVLTIKTNDRKAMRKMFFISLISTLSVLGCASSNSQNQSQSQQVINKEQFGKAPISAEKVARDAFGENDPRYRDTQKRLQWVYEADKQWRSKHEPSGTKLSPEESFQLQTARIQANALIAAPLNDRPGSEILIRKMIGIEEKYAGNESLQLVPLLHKLGALQASSNPPRFAEAEAEYMRAKAILEKHGKTVSTQMAQTSLGLGKLYKQWNKPAEAKANIQQAATIYSTLYGPEDIRGLEARRLLEQ